MTSRTIAIVGGGAGGMCAAIGASDAIRESSSEIAIRIYERNPRPGIKILISGGGKCNITHHGPVEEVLKEGFLRTNEQRFLKSALYRYTNEDLLRMLESHGLTWHARDNGRIFPDSGRAEDVLRAFEQELRARDISVRCRSRVEAVEPLKDAWQITINGESQRVDALILATGGTSYRKVGTTGDGLDFAARLGHIIVPLASALAPIYLWRPPVQELVGLAVRDAELLVVRDQKILKKHRGDVLLTHKGISGPATLDISRDATEHMAEGPISMAINLLAKPEDTLRMELQQAQKDRAQQQVNTWLEEVLPNRLAPFILERADIPQDRRWHALTKDERQRLLSTLMRYDLGAVREIPLDRGEVTAGGVSLKEVDPKTMMSRLAPGLFFAGEMLDIAGEIGGYNLQAAYSTGYVAGQSAVQHLLHHPSAVLS